MICLSERKISIHQNKGLIQLPEISKSSELLRLNNIALQSGKNKKKTKPQSPDKDTYYLKLPQINKKPQDKSDNFFKLSKSQLQTQKILYGDTSLDNIKKYNKQIQDIQNKHNHYINKIEELYMITKQHS
ncbi:unnamed protein product (macronuclear) [Paramecium tetraurelia]|uniref:Enkurin domain-containing protein n=1 Tax=Paramecium tetraurelia TaxID=5888 RepID=A0DH63_PARTE|nr:uncharacterized protein GSPATT00016766001 [Paramecium tetraurelia]CAK82380.1 unnamed protein product [Paramecium tetraurelia]|eukprot:XP_001449777.1 hypothetical protein (macronuclear) [Paramecium tetraurelia strain d4-2]